jgi:VWFA-related protein
MRPLGGSAVLKFILASGAGLALLAQQPPGSGGTIKVTTRLVQVNVLVHDHNGKPVGGLTKADFEIKDAGKVQKISLFSVDQLLANPAAGVPVQTLPQNFVTNRPMSLSGGPANVTVVLIDTYNTNLTDQAYANQQLTKFLKQVRPDDRIAIYTLNSNGFGIVHDFTNNAQALEAALSGTTLRYSHQRDGSTFDPANTGIGKLDGIPESQNMDAILDAQNAIVANFFTRNRVINTCASLKSLADHLTGISGRKNLVWLTGSVPIDIGFGDPQDVMQAKQQAGGAAGEKDQLDRYVEEASRALNTANIAVYPVDVRGLVGLPFTDASKRIKLDRTRGIPASMSTVDNRNVLTMNYVADLTGGRAFLDTNDLAGALRKAIDDSAVTYTLGYHVQEADWGSKYHKINVTVKRPGVKIRTKKGYLAKETPTLSSGQLDDVLRKAVWSPLDSTQLAVTARINPSPALPNASRLGFVLLPEEIQFRQEGGKFHADLDIAFVQERKRGQRITDLKRNFKIDVTPERFQVMAQSGIVLSEDLPIEPDTVAVRIFVLDRFSSAMGSVTIAVDAANKSGVNVTPVPEKKKAPSQ